MWCKKVTFEVPLSFLTLSQIKDFVTLSYSGSACSLTKALHYNVEEDWRQFDSAAAALASSLSVSEGECTERVGIVTALAGI